MADEKLKLNGETEEIRDILIAISVVAKRLATKLETNLKQEESYESEKRNVGSPE